MAKVNPIPDGCEGTIPHLVVKGGNQALDFYKKAFGAEEVFRMPSPDGRPTLQVRLENADGSRVGRVVFDSSGKEIDVRMP